MSTENNQTSATRLVKFKTLDNNITEMTVDPDIPVKDLKVRIKDKLNIAPESQRLIVMGKQLNDNKKLSDYVSQDGQVIHLLARVAESTQPQSQSSTANTTSSAQQPQQNQYSSTHTHINDPYGLNGILGNYLNNPGMVMTSVIIDQNGNNISSNTANSNTTTTTTSNLGRGLGNLGGFGTGLGSSLGSSLGGLGSLGNLGNLDIDNILQNLGIDLNNPNTTVTRTRTQTIHNQPSSAGATTTTTTSSSTNDTNNTNTNNASNATSNTATDNLTNPNTNTANNTSNVSNANQAQPSPYPILDETNRNISNLTNLVNQLNGDLSNNEVPSLPSLNYPVNILTTFGTTLKNYHNNLQRMLPYVNQLADLLQRESLISNPQDRQNANRLGKNLLTGIRDISGANKMIETFLAGLEFGNRPGGGMVTFIQGSINQIQVVGEALDNLNNTNPISFNINIQNNPNNLSASSANNTSINPTSTATATTTLNNNNVDTLNSSNNPNAPSTTTTANNIPSYPNLNQTASACNSSDNAHTNNTNNSTVVAENAQQAHPNPLQIQPDVSTLNANQTANSTSSARPAAGGLNSLLGNLMGNMGNLNASAQGAGNRPANPMGNLGALVSNIMSNPETSSIVNNVMSNLARPGAQNNLAGMFGSLMGGMNAGNSQGGQPDFGSLFSSLMGNLGGAGGQDDNEREFEMHPEIKKLCENKNNWKKTKLADLKATLEMEENPQFKELVEILLDLTIDEFYLLKRLQLEGLTRQAKKIRELIETYLKQNNKSLEQLKQHIVDLLNENFILAESDEHKIKAEGFDLESYSASFISDILDYFLNTNLSEQELNDKLNKRVVDFLGLVFSELKKVYTSERDGALFYFAENFRDFVENNFGEDSIDNLLEINEKVFEELVSNGVDFYEQTQKYELLRKKTSGNVEQKSEAPRDAFEVKDMEHVLAIAGQDEKRFEKKNINFSDEYKRTSLFKD